AAVHVAVTATVQQQRRRLNAVECGPDVGAQVEVKDGFEGPGAAGQPLAASPAPPLPGIAGPAGGQGIHESTGPDVVAEGLDIPGEGRLGYPVRVSRGSGESARMGSRAPMSARAGDGLPLAA